MLKKLSPEQVRHLRLRAQHLHPDVALSDVAQLVYELCGLQAQELLSVTLAVRPRSHNITSELVKQAREEQRSIVLTRGMRGTRHLVATEDLSWLLPLFGPAFIHGSERRYKQLGLSPEIRTQAVKEMRRVLGKQGPLSRPALAEALAEKGIPVAGQAIAHLVGYAALSGVVCFGPERDGALTYVLLDDWVRQGDPLEPEQALSGLARRYLQAHGPATPLDLASWSGLSISQARAAFESVSSDLQEFTHPQIWMLKEQVSWLDEPLLAPVVRLLPRYDDYLLGYRSRDFMVSKAHARRIHPGGGQINSTVIVGGCAVGIWNSVRKRGGVTIVVEPFETLLGRWMPALQAEVQDIRRFLGQETGLRLEGLK